MRTKCSWWLLAAFFVSLMVGKVEGQIGNFRGVIKDKTTGQPIKDVVISIEGLDMKRTYTVKTDKNGKYVHAGVPLQGTYMITAKKEGYQSDGVRGVRPGFGMDDPRGEQNFSLSPGQSGKAGVELTAEERTALQKQQAESTKKEQSVAELKQFFELGLQQVSLGQFAEAVESFKKAAEKDPEQPAVWANLGSAYGKLKQWDPAVEAYNKAIALKPNDPALYQNLAGVYSDAGDLDKSKEYFEKAAQIAATQDPKTAATQYYNIGVTNINAGRSQEAAEALNKALEFDPNHAEAHYQLGLTLLGLNKIEEAVSHLKKYAELAPAGPNAETAKALVDELGKAKK